MNLTHVAARIIETYNGIPGSVGIMLGGLATTAVFGWVKFWSAPPRAPRYKARHAVKS